jgi:hypothetical protein
MDNDKRIDGRTYFYCICSSPYEGARPFDSPRTCERCGGLVRVEGEAAPAPQNGLVVKLNNAMQDELCRGCSAIVERIIVSSLAAPAPQAAMWLKVPNEQEWWWHWDGEDYSIPFIYSVMVSKTGPDRYFVSFPDSRWCDDIGGWWMKVERPNVPSREYQALNVSQAEAPQAATLDESKIDTTGFTDAQCRQVLAAIQLSRELGFRDGRSSVGQAEAPRPSAPTERAIEVLADGSIKDLGPAPELKTVIRDATGEAESRPSAEEVLAGFRADGWMVAVHNDYRVNGEAFTFWLLTKGDRCAKGEGRTDLEALNAIRIQERITRP